jgi:hypothetical protein
MRDTRVARAKKVLTRAQDEAEDAKEDAPSRSTGTRAAYKVKAEAADRAVEILSERPPR